MTDTTKIQKIIIKYHEELPFNELDNLKEMDKLLEIYGLPRINRKFEQTNSTNKIKIII